MRWEIGRSFVRALALSALVGAGLPLAGCGYTLGPTTPSSVVSIAIPIFNNETFPLRREVEFDLTDAFRKEVQTRTNLRLVDHTEADLIVYGTIQEFRERTVTEGRQDQKIESNLYAQIELVVEDHINRRRWTQLVRRVEPFSVERGETFEVGRNRAIANLAERMVFALEYWEPPAESTTDASSPEPSNDEQAE